MEPQLLPLPSKDLREEPVEVMDIETGVTEEQGDLIRGSFLEGILSGDALPPTKSADLVPQHSQIQLLQYQ